MTPSPKMILSFILSEVTTKSFNCYWTRHPVVFAAYGKFDQSSINRIGLQLLSYYERGQITVLACLWAQHLFNDMNPDKCKRLIRLLIQNYDPTRAHVFVNNYKNGINNGVVLTAEATKYWESKLESQSKEARDAFANTPSKQKRMGRGICWGDIHNWEKEAKVEDNQLKGRHLLAKLGSIGTTLDTYPASVCLNDACEADPSYHTPAGIVPLAAKLGVSDLDAIIKKQREMEALIAHWRGRD
ncbi:hypothetical protein BC830DRAFT_1204025 [Chytriomyces sp. MP71]|nr:hypothetical protein BC830DRAFT_1204025 [Chytriomyces sp. MP71]